MAKPPTLLRSRRARARIWVMVTLGLSSIQIGAEASLPKAPLIRRQSSSPSRPSRMLTLSTLASDDSSRWVSSMWPISSENNSTGKLWRTPALATIPSAKAVLPIEGRAPTTYSEDGCSPEVSLSSSM